LLIPTKSPADYPRKKKSYQNEIEKILECLNVPTSSNFAWWSLLDKFDKRLLVGATVSYILGLVCAWLTHVPRIRHETVVACYGLLLLGQIACIVFAVKQAADSFKSFLRPTKALLDARGPVISCDAQILDCIQKFDPDCLEFVGKRFVLEAKQARKRTYLFSPGLEKLGIVPASTAAILSVYGFAEAFGKTGWELPANILLYICVAMCILNLCAIPLLTGTDRFDQLAQLLQFAAATKRGKAMEDGEDGRDDAEGNADEEGDGNSQPNT